MAGSEKITAMPAAAGLSGTEPMPVVQTGTNVQTTTGAIAGLAPQGTVTSIATAGGIKGGPITGSGTISLDGTFTQYGVLVGTGSDITATAAGTTGQVLTANTGGNPTWGAGASGTVTKIVAGAGLTGGTITNTGTLTTALNIDAQVGTTYTLAIGDAQSLVTLSNASSITLTIPTNASVAFPVGTTIALEQAGAGKVTVAAAGGVTLNYLSTLTLALLGQYAVAQLVKTATDTWTLFGAIGG